MSPYCKDGCTFAVKMQPIGHLFRLNVVVLSKFEISRLSKKPFLGC